ncbi:movement protein [Switchgrass mosaic-associated virus 1]|uniref:Movement protein n=1 Tax=Switchgrass mosaic-associated virus 1 TaxID=1571533 RepID=A0A0A0QTH0_9GEMI|nr:movement protein [Switchgrass mosaic-associated virus 1]AIT39766.1 movement protein [Switchgrass mosaic-associated virus 1]AIT99286.1 movement protein [Switchgrass mosaic-associated virus 1]
MEKGPGPQLYPATITAANPAGVGNDGAWRSLVLIFTIVSITLAAIAGSYYLCVKDCLLTWRARRSRTVTELGFGTTPQRAGGNSAASGSGGPSNPPFPI